ncbi:MULTISPECIES: Fe(3+) dicitrate ABC transporter ATP-binding protein FecE [Pasteurella]|uniref:Fe(3+) dicitrate ABC transporter ATP-binding protein FecE n=1 Tax=Pasteurella TaxID=745 RepID=UPI00076DBC83|nr:MULTISPECIES: Fe(3+) dicitrate ABC transporter ATP-binding protein FecE [Pasteurella]AMM81987.1 iron ABC transporter [Pasteurella multocida subsp. multocida PMTB2.1]APW56725.1 ferric citrate ABC transporter ATP-binding protein FecE [Pasteurella multocida]AXQ71764.1 iron ABC transporter [Pasteurella multocida subsp. multocida]KWW09730.1 iron ABC transporter [Pasteurella multocida]MCH4804277.1 Fe(3+) dicitrate ABC transporter ATP-binding protein FecE [Pasteurella multocida]
MSLTVEHLQLAYQDKTIVSNLNLRLPSNKVIALIGPNGCGKSTLLKALARLLKPKSGQVKHQKQDIWQITAKSYAKTLAFLPQQHLVPEGIKVRELVAYGRSPYLNLWGKLSEKDEKIVTQAMQITQTDAFAERLATDLSGGQQQRVFLAMTLAQDANIVLLDEPTTYLDLNHQAELMSMMRRLQQQGKTVITVLHDLNQACRYCDYLVVLKQGELIAQGTPHEVMTEHLLKQVFDLNVEIHQDPISFTPMFILKAH